MFGSLFGKKRKALVVEDEEGIRKLLTNYLKMEKFAITQASNGAEALEVLKRMTPDLLVTDLLMPKMSGVEFIKVFRKQHPKTPIIVVTGVGSDEVTDPLKDKYTNLAILDKPFRGTDLLRCAREATGTTASTKA
ncbi:MAG: response regulator [Planctomycetota bacterium]|jgi:DNA-binding NtrC family response regulator